MEQTTQPLAPTASPVSRRTRARSEASKALRTSLRIETGFEDIMEERKVYAWLNAGLRPHRPGRLQREYPFLFAKGTNAIPIIGDRAGQPAAFCSLWPCDFSFGRGHLRLGLISLVYTAPEFRGRGDATQVVEAAVATAESLGMGCVALWSELDAFYAGLGFRLAGSESLIQLDTAILDRALANTERLEGVKELQLRRPQAADWAEIESLRARRSCNHALALSPSRLDAIPDMQVRVARDANSGRTVAYAMRGRGDDFPGVIHEWGGETGATLRCFRALTASAPATQSTFLLAPAERMEVTWQLRSAGAHMQNQPLARFRIANRKAFAEDLSECTGHDLLVSQADSGNNASLDAPLRLRSAHGECEVGVQTLLDGSFGSASPRAVEAAMEKLSTLFPADQPPPLPLPFFVSGLESI